MPVPRDEEVPRPDATSDAADTASGAALAAPGPDAAEEAPGTGGPIATGLSDEYGEPTKAVNFVGPRRFVGFSENSSRILEAILTYLLCHDTHHLSADQIALGMWPYGRSRGEATRKTIQNNASALRNWIGAEHLPDAAVAGGYLVEGIATDWAAIERLSAEAQTVGADAARALRTEALGLVRGLPFEGLSGDGYDWIEYEDLVSTVTVTIVRCAQRLGQRPLRGRRLQRGRSCRPGRPARGAQPSSSSGSWALGPLTPGESAARSRPGGERRPVSSTPPPSIAFAVRSVTTGLPSHNARRRGAAPLRPAGAPSWPLRRVDQGSGPPRGPFVPRCVSGRSARPLGV